MCWVSAPVYNLTISRTRAEANDTLWVEFEVPPKLKSKFIFRQGQHLTFVATINGTDTRRSYSICSAVGGPLAVAIKRVEGGAFSCHAHAEFRPGVQVRVLPPQGQFRSSLAPENDKDYLCIAAGGGITPVISIVQTILETEPASRVTLLYGNRRSQDVIFRERLLWLKNAHLARFQWLNIFSRETQAAPILSGRINNRKGAQLNRCLIDIAGYDEFFLCGPEAMMSEVARGLRAEGIEEAKIHYELFFTSAEDARKVLDKHRERARQFGGLTTEVCVRSGGREIVFELAADGENILDGALDAGLALPFSCKKGVCATCKARLVEGEVDMDIHHALAPEEVAQGYLLTCQAHPISKRVMVDFDVG